jgi:hypothetical protein
MTIDPRCCGSGTCIVDAAGRCWCGQQWNGQKMADPPRPDRRDIDDRPESQATVKPPDA